MDGGQAAGPPVWGLRVRFGGQGKDLCGQILSAVKITMRNMNDPTGRALTLLSLLQTHRFWSGEELSERLEVSSRTLRRDVDRLRTLGYQIDGTTGITGGYRLAAGSHLPPLLLDDDEAVAIALGLRSTATTAIDGMGDTSARALAKIEQVLPGRLRRRVTALHANITPLRWGGSPPEPVDPEALALIAQGCRDGEQIRFDYRRKDGEEASRLVEPHQLVSAGARWYLVAWDVRRDDWRTFRVDRLSEARLGGVRFSARRIPGGDAAEFVKHSIGHMPQAHEVSAVMAIDAQTARSELQWLDVQVQELAKSSRHPVRCRLVFRAPDRRWLAGAVAMAALVAPIELDPPAKGTGPGSTEDVESVRAHLATLSGRLTELHPPPFLSQKRS